MAEVKKDCFAYKTDTNRGSALNDTYCRYEKCPFYKPKKQIKEKK